MLEVRFLGPPSPEGPVPGRSRPADALSLAPQAHGHQAPRGVVAFSAQVTVGLFRAPLDLDAQRLEAFAALLSAQEIAAADGRPTPRERARLIADHGWRRRLLGDWLGQAPDELAFIRGDHGKPSLVGDGPSFSASRSEDVAWYAVSDQAEVGVDVERIDHRSPLEPLARRLLGASERARYDAFGVAERPRALSACWTCKEAAVKALGTGLVFPLTTLEVWAGDGRPVRAHGLEVRELAAGPERTAAVAVRVADGEAVAIQGVVDLAAR